MKHYFFSSRYRRILDRRRVKWLISTFFALCLFSLLNAYINLEPSVEDDGENINAKNTNDLADLGIQLFNHYGQNIRTKFEWDRLQLVYDSVKTGAQDFPNVNRHTMEKMLSSGDTKTKIVVATVGCGSRSADMLVMVKSAVMFSQHADLHLIVFTDEKTITFLGESLMKLKWSVQELGWDFSFELQLEGFPQKDQEEWRTMRSPCTTQRLFFPSLLPHVDSVIYLDADLIVMSNLSVLWSQFAEKMGQGQVGAMSANTERGAKGWYNYGLSKVPYYGERGLNAGVILMNLTRMREFQFEKKVIKYYKKYKSKLELADQDILNIIFNKYPEKMTELSCSFNFNSRHCPHPINKPKCYYNKDATEPVCYCKDIDKIGVNILHGLTNQFHRTEYPFLRQAFERFQEFDILRDSYDSLLTLLVNDFKALKSPCFSLTAEQLYGNAIAYLNIVSQPQN